MSERRVSAYERLQALPNWFSLRSAELYTGLDLKTLRTHIYRWQKKGLITPLGPKAGVYINRVREPDISANTRAEAIQHIYPEAVVMGATVLHAQGWITQIPNRLHLAILDKQTERKLDGIELHWRSKRWFTQTADQMASDDDAAVGAGIRELMPAAALADLIKRDALPVDWDDLDFDEEDHEAILEMAKRFHTVDKIDDNDLLMASDGLAGRRSISP